MGSRRVPPRNPANDLLATECDVTVITYNRPIPPLTWCHYCGFLASTRDHIVPDSVGGVKAWWNLVPSCRSCNEGKADRQACSCLFCVRAIALWGLGFRRVGLTRGQKARLRRDKELA